MRTEPQSFWYWSSAQYTLPHAPFITIKMSPSIQFWWHPLELLLQWPWSSRPNWVCLQMHVGLHLVECSMLPVSIHIIIYISKFNRPQPKENIFTRVAVLCIVFFKTLFNTSFDITAVFGLLRDTSISQMLTNKNHFAFGKMKPGGGLI